ncbi:hypothetical protein PPTG_20804 [Phytophthora nicotianae INRA-310]|uniref:Uncharacterized protein n=1 Tax=Phytophthora nicotianae (strain INRA-310) TaxID=761204 RepID=W2RGU6_PHYN3|nr:hypothetical protein PPTG_20804 [Phytophthora nicotianae INRA-310]ETN24642.1 hypothetical protein PPTG_20804 [Phytophthora nicotianae INRA-310]
MEKFLGRFQLRVVFAHFLDKQQNTLQRDDDQHAHACFQLRISDPRSEALGRTTATR